MKSFFCPLFILFILSPSAMSYPKDQLDACIQSARINPAVSGESDSSIKEYCHCALKAIMDEGKKEKNSATRCAKKNFRQ